MKDSWLTIVTINQKLKYYKNRPVDEINENFLEGLSFFFRFEYSVNSIFCKFSGLLYGNNVSIE